MGEELKKNKMNLQYQTVKTVQYTMKLFTKKFSFYIGKKIFARDVQSK